jgi:P-type conjugative transfer protein TrbG
MTRRSSLRPACAGLSLCILVAGAAHAQTADGSTARAGRTGARPAQAQTVKIITIPQPLPLPGQLKPFASRLRRSKFTDPRVRVTAANAAARIEPSPGDYLNAIQQFPWSEGALYQVYASPGEVTDIALQEGEQLVGSGPVAAGDTVRWIIGDTVSGTGPNQRVHILLKPTRPDLETNLVINTDRRTYHLELRATPSTYLASVSWTYPQDQLVALKAANAVRQRKAPIATGINLAALHFGYRIDGKARWRPERVFDDGRQVFIAFPIDVATGEMPPLFVIGAKGATELVNYRVQDHYMIVDQLFDTAELRIGTKKDTETVRIEREGARGRDRS